jgi:hypothetical protein
MEPTERWYEKIPLPPLLLFAVIATLGASLVQPLGWMALCLVSVTLLWIGIAYVLLQRFGGSETDSS